MSALQRTAGRGSHALLVAGAQLSTRAALRRVAPALCSAMLRTPSQRAVSSARHALRWWARWCLWNSVCGTLCVLFKN